MDISIFGTPVCPNCQKVKNFLDSKKISYQYQTIGEDVERMYVDTLVGHRVQSVPVIIVDDNEVSFDELRRKVDAASCANVLGGLEL